MLNTQRSIVNNYLTGGPGDQSLAIDAEIRVASPSHNASLNMSAKIITVDMTKPIYH